MAKPLMLITGSSRVPSDQELAELLGRIQNGARVIENMPSEFFAPPDQKLHAYAEINDSSRSHDLDSRTSRIEAQNMHLDDGQAEESLLEYSVGQSTGRRGREQQRNLSSAGGAEAGLADKEASIFISVKKCIRKAWSRGLIRGDH